MATWQYDEKTDTYTSQGIDVGYIAATQPSLLAEGIDTEQEILKHYATVGQRAGMPANYNEHLARDVGFQGTFDGNWDTEVEQFFASGGAEAGFSPPQVYNPGTGWVDRTNTNELYDVSRAPDSGIWLGEGALEDGWIYQNLFDKNAPRITADSGEVVLNAGEMYWDPDVTGSAAGAGIQDHRLVTQYATNVRTADSNYDVDQTVRWGSFKDAPYNNFAHFDNFVTRMVSEGKMRTDLTPAQREALVVGGGVGLGVKDYLMGRTRNFENYSLTPDEWMNEAYPVLARGGAAAPKGTDPGYFVGGSDVVSKRGGKKVIGPSSWADVPAMDKFARAGLESRNIGYRQTANEFLGRGDVILYPSDAGYYEYQLAMRNFGAPPGTFDRDLSVEGGGWAAESSQPRGNGGGRDDLDDDEPRGPKPGKTKTNFPGIFSNGFTGYGGAGLFTVR